MTNLSDENPTQTDLAAADTLDVHQAVDQQLRSLQRFGLTIVPKGNGEVFNFSAHEEPTAVAPQQANAPTPTATSAAVDPPKPAAMAPVAQTPAPVSPQPPAEAPTAPAGPVDPPVSTSDPYPAIVAAEQRPASLQVISKEVTDCHRCPQLAEFRTQTVFGVGDPNARLVFVGEGPGEQEDRAGLPFVDAAGQLLDKILGACGLHRDQVYILNTVKCRPPQNRNPKQNELENCWGYGRRQLEILQPEFICCLGSVAAKTVLNTNLAVGKLRRRFHDYRGSKVMVTYHPAYLLRTSSAKKHAWDDMQMLMREMGIKIPKR